MKKFKIESEDIKEIAPGHGACLASEMILVDGHLVGFMYREAPDFAEDSGWRFLTGLESDEYMKDPNKFALYDINTIANYDPDIVQFLAAPIGTAFERVPPDNALVFAEGYELPQE